jgi:hypothetical protein
MAFQNMNKIVINDKNVIIWQQANILGGPVEAEAFNLVMSSGLLTKIGTVPHDYLQDSIITCR